MIVRTHELTCSGLDQFLITRTISLEKKSPRRGAESFAVQTTELAIIRIIVSGSHCINIDNSQTALSGPAGYFYEMHLDSVCSETSVALVIARRSRRYIVR